MTLREKLAKLLTDARAIFEAASKENRELTADEYTKQTAILTEARGIKKTIQAEQTFAFEAFEALLHANGAIIDAGTANQIVSGAGRTNLDGDRVKKVREQFNHFLRTGHRQEFVMTSGDDSGAYVPREVETPIIVRRMWNAWLNAMAIGGEPVLATDGTETFNMPVLDDSSNTGQNSNENATTDTEAVPAETVVSLGATLNDSKSIWLSNTLLRALGYDLTGYVLAILDKRIELIQDSTWSTKALTHQSAGNTVRTATATGITYANVVIWFHSLAPQFRTDGVFLISDTLAEIMESITDNYGRPLLADPITKGEMSTIKGKPAIISPSLPAVAANAVVGVFASAASLKARVCRDRRVARYVNVPTFPDQIGFREFQNSDFDLAPGYEFLQMAAS